MKVYIIASLFMICPFLPGMAQEVQVIKFNTLESLLTGEGDKVRIINFWATWCAPCIKEMPYFEKALADRPDEVELYFISLDYADALDKVKDFVRKKSIQGTVFILDELDYNSWIDRVDASWSGAIPATLFLNPQSGDRQFVESALNQEEIDSHINAVQKNQ